MKTVAISLANEKVSKAIQISETKASVFKTYFTVRLRFTTFIAVISAFKRTYADLHRVLQGNSRRMRTFKG